MKKVYTLSGGSTAKKVNGRKYLIDGWLPAIYKNGIFYYILPSNRLVKLAKVYQIKRREQEHAV